MVVFPNPGAIISRLAFGASEAVMSDVWLLWSLHLSDAERTREVTKCQASQCGDFVLLSAD